MQLIITDKMIKNENVLPGKSTPDAKVSKTGENGHPLNGCDTKENI
jgi:hypothetical protein